MSAALQIQETDRVFRLIKPQAGFIRTNARYPAYVGGWGTGKSTAGIGRAMRLSEAFPGNLGLVGRKEFEDLKDSTIKDFQDYTGLKVDSGREVKLPNGSIIMFRHLEEMNNIQNINLGWFWIEQAEELDTDDIFFKLFGRLRRANVLHSGFITANTNGHNWIYKLWKAGGLVEAVKKMMRERPDLFPADVSPERYVELYEAKTAQNAHNLAPEFIASLELIKTQKPRLYARFVENSWDESDAADNVIQPEWVRAAYQRSINITKPIRRVASIDVARYGDDKTTIYGIENYRTIGRDEWEKKSTMETVGRAVLFGKKHNIKAFAVDEIGVGGGVADRLQELGYEVIFVNAAERGERVRTGCYNRRAEIYLNGAELLQEGRVQIDPSYTDLCEQLSWAKYKTVKSNGIVQVEPKDDIKERYGRSPDDADAYLNGLWALPQVNAVAMRDAYDAPERHEYYGNSATV